jgi:hypothetical protein
MIITIVAFNLKEINSVYYKKLKTTKKAVEWFEHMLNDPNVDFLSIRKVKVTLLKEETE